MNTIAPVIIGAIITAILGNFLVQRWQLNNWRVQQRQLGYQSEVADLKNLVNDITDRTSERYLTMRNVLNALRPGSQGNLDQALNDYRTQIDLWNKSLNWLFVRIRLAVNYGETIRFENEVHKSFVNAGKEIEKIVRINKSGNPVKWSEIEYAGNVLNEAKSASYIFLRDLVDNVERRQDEIYFGKKLHYESENLHEYGTFDLIKCLFVQRVDAFYVIRTP